VTALSRLGKDSNVPLDLDALYRRVRQMVRELPDLTTSQELDDALAFLQRADPHALREKLQQRERSRKIPWLVAVPLGSLADTFAAPRRPCDLSIVAADGSTIPPDRHSPIRYYVLNVGYVVLTYGSAASASLGSDLQFCFEQDDLYFDPDGKRIPIEGTRLGIKMSIEEAAGLWRAAQEAPAPAVAVSDGSLILWNLQSEDTDLQAHYLSEFLAALNAFRQAHIPVASYISFPGSSDVINSLRLLLCDVESPGCSRCPQQTEAQALCRFMGGLSDRQLYGALLEPGYRSDVFSSQSAILAKYDGHRICFFYLNVGGEIARIEAPRWVMRDPGMLDLVHSAIYDQCQRSGQYPPYPPALIEAHEQAVISSAERQAVEHIVERELAALGLGYVRSAKDRSKRSRGV